MDAKAFVDKIGKFLDWDDTEEGRWGLFMRVQTLIDIINSLKRGSMTKNKLGQSIKR